MQQPHSEWGAYAGPGGSNDRSSRPPSVRPTMFQHQGIWLPKGEKHFPEWMTNNGELVDGKGTYQIKKFRAAMRQVRQFRCAVDIGAHVGLWSMQLAKHFLAVVAFEPVAAFRECFELNTAAKKCVLHPCALGAAPGRVAMEIPSLDGGLDTGGTHIAGAGDIEMRTLDSFDMPYVDFIKIDCEGYELEVLKGARETLERSRPCVIVEQKPHKLGPNFGIHGTPAVDFLVAMGAKQRAVLSGDYILSWD